MSQGESLLPHGRYGSFLRVSLRSDALRDLANETSLDLEPDFAAIRSQFDPIAAAFAGDKIGSVLPTVRDQRPTG